MGILAALDPKGIAKSFGSKKSTDGLALPAPTKGPLGGAGMPAMPGQSPLGMSLNAPPGNSLAARGGQRSPLG